MPERVARLPTNLPPSTTCLTSSLITCGHARVMPVAMCIMHVPCTWPCASCIMPVSCHIRLCHECGHVHRAYQHMPCMWPFASCPHPVNVSMCITHVVMCFTCYSVEVYLVRSSACPLLPLPAHLCASNLPALPCMHAYAPHAKCFTVSVSPCTCAQAKPRAYAPVRKLKPKPTHLCAA